MAAEELCAILVFFCVTTNIILLYWSTSTTIQCGYKAGYDYDPVVFVFLLESAIQKDNNYLTTSF